MALIYPGMVVTEAYYCTYVGNICPSLDMVLLVGWIVSVCLPETEFCTAGCCSSVGCYLDALWLSYYCIEGDVACSFGSGELSLVVRPLSYG